MIFNDHSELEGRHAFLGASKWQWLNYDDETLYLRYRNSYSQSLGTALHELAKQLIKFRIKVAETDRKMVMLHLLNSGIPAFAIDMDGIFGNFKAYVNDAIGYRMTPEVVLFHSYTCFGTADTICFRDNFLRVHDYKSGSTPAHIEQLLIYAGLFCLEYKDRIRFSDFEAELRIYQNPEVLIHNPSREELNDVVEKIISSDKSLKTFRELEA